MGTHAIFPLAPARLSWHPDVQSAQEPRVWLANSPSGQSGDINDFSRPTRAFAARIRSCTAAPGARATPSTRSKIMGSGVRSLRSDSAFVTAKTPRLPCAQIAPSMPIGRKTRQMPPAKAANANGATARPGAASTTPAIARKSLGADLPFPRSAPLALGAAARNPRPLMRPQAARAAAASIVPPPPATDAAAAIAARPADDRLHLIVTHPPVAPARPGSSYSPIPAATRQSQCFGDTP